jgi:hypothetical protein
LNDVAETLASDCLRKHGYGWINGWNQNVAV